MGGVIELSESVDSGHLWAGWIFRQILEDTLAQHPDDKEMSEAFETAEAIGGLVVYSFPRNLADRVISAMRTAIEDILAGKTQSKLEEKRYNNALSREQYREVLQTVLAQLPPSPTN
jgi:hypothetical protein